MTRLRRTTTLLTLCLALPACTAGQGSISVGPASVPASFGALASSPAPAVASALPSRTSATGPPATDPPATDPVVSMPPAGGAGLPGMPAVLDPRNVYSADSATNFAPATRGALSRVYVPNGISDTVDVIDPATYKVVKTLRVGRLPQHVVPSWDLKTLWVTDDKSNDLMAIDPKTATVVRTVQVDDPYNLYFTPDGKAAMVMAEALRRIDFRDPQTMALETPLNVGCKGVDHGDFTADGRYFIASCEFAGEMVVVDVAARKVDGYISLGSSRYSPQDVKLSPDGSTFYVADMHANGVWKIDAHTWKLLGLLPTGKGAHGLYLSRDDTTMYVTNRDAGSVGVIDLANGTLRATWHLPGNASPDMGNVNAAGTVLWLSGRYNSEVYALDTATGALIARIPTGVGPHGLCVWPQPGRYSIGHTGIMR